MTAGCAFRVVSSADARWLVVSRSTRVSSVSGVACVLPLAQKVQFLYLGEPCIKDDR